MQILQNWAVPAEFRERELFEQGFCSKGSGLEAELEVESEVVG